MGEHNESADWQDGRLAGLEEAAQMAEATALVWRDTGFEAIANTLDSQARALRQIIRQTKGEGDDLDGAGLSVIRTE